MKTKRKYNNLGGEIKRIRIPDEDMSGWIKVLKEGGDMSLEEINLILSHLNTTYRDQIALTDKKARDAVIKDVIQEIRIYLLQKYQKIINPQFEEYFKLRISQSVERGLNSGLSVNQIIQNIREEIDNYLEKNNN
jgi:hypothetical protein